MERRPFGSAKRGGEGADAMARERKPTQGSLMVGRLRSVGFGFVHDATGDRLIGKITTIRLSARVLSGASTARHAARICTGQLGMPSDLDLIEAGL
jgi:hypothetical protein